MDTLTVPIRREGALVEVTVGLSHPTDLALRRWGLL
jgi:hypothetical protein